MGHGELGRAQGLQEPGKEGHREIKAKGTVESEQTNPQLCFSLGLNRHRGARDGPEVEGRR